MPPTNTRGYGLVKSVPSRVVQSKTLSPSVSSPGALVHARQLAAVRHFAQAHAAQAELAVHRVRPAAALAAGVGADSELRLAVGLVDQCFLGHVSVLLEREAEVLQQGTAFFVVGRGGDNG